MLEWNVFHQNMNTQKIENFNIFNHGSFYKDIKTAFLKSRGDKIEFGKKLLDEVRYYYWSKCEHEITIGGWPRDDRITKVDVARQIEMNWEIFVDYVWSNVAKEITADDVESFYEDIRNIKTDTNIESEDENENEDEYEDETMEDIRDYDLAPCPFCKSKTTPSCYTVAEAEGEDHATEWNANHYTVVCDYHKGGCGASCGLMNDTPEEAINNWNRCKN